MNRVVVTGMGVVTPLGNDLDTFRENLLAGKSGIGPLTLFPAASLPSKIAGECTLHEKTFEVPPSGGKTNGLPQNRLKAVLHTSIKDRKIHFALAAAQSAIDHANGFGDPLNTVHDPGRTGLSIGTGLELFDMADMIRFSNNHYEIPDADQGRIDFLQTPADLCVHLLTDRFDLRLPPGIHVSACAAGNDAIGHGFLRIRRGEADMMLAGGADSMINPLGLGGFCKLHALSTRNHEPGKASRPFDADRDGFVIGEGAALLVLENRDHAIGRNARIYAEIKGYGNSFDAYSVSEPHPKGRGAYQAMKRAVDMAGIRPGRISYINAHGTSTLKNDPVETQAIKKLLGDAAHRVPVSATKSMTGHLIAAAGAVESVAAIVCANIGYAHPTINLDNPDPACDLDYIPHTARPLAVTFFLNNAFAFGGQNACLVFENTESLWKPKK